LIVGYSRVSRHSQEGALEQQQARLKNAGCQKIYCDIESGRKSDRAQFTAMMKDCELGKITEIVVTRLDRLTRSLPTLRRAIDELRSMGINLRALDDSIDLATASGKFHLNIIGSLAEMESDRLAERVKHGWQHVRNSTKAINPPFGYAVTNNRYQLDHSPFLCLLSNSEERSRVQIGRELIDAFLEQQTLRKGLRIINQRYGLMTVSYGKGRHAQGLFRFSPSGYRDWLMSPVLRGHTCYKKKKEGHRLPSEQWDMRFDTHPTERLLSDEEYAEIGKILEFNSLHRGYGSTALKYPVSGLVFCAECRAACYSCRGGVAGETVYFQCKNWRSRGCSQKQTIRFDVVEPAVIEALVVASSRIADLASQPEPETESVAVKELRQQMEGLKALGINPAIEQAKKEIENQIALLKFEENEKSEKSQSNRDLLLWAFSDPNIFKNCSTEEKTRVFRALVEKVLVKEGRIIDIFLKL
jgi:site-specific DNA recombinase